MILQNSSEDNKIFIDDYFTDNESLIIEKDDNGVATIFKKNTESFNISFNREVISYDIIKLIYDPSSDTLTYMNNESIYGGGRKIIKDNEIISIEIDEMDGDTILITSMELPKFLSQDNYDEKYPKFEVNLSDCTYGMKIYMNDSEYIQIPDFQSHNNIHSTLDYIAQLVFYLTEGRPGFFEKLCNSNSIEILIKDKGCEKFAYVLGEEGIFLTGGELEDYPVYWQNFFKLVMDGKWEVDFE